MSRFALLDALDDEEDDAPAIVPRAVVTVDGVPTFDFGGTTCVDHSDTCWIADTLRRNPRKVIAIDLSGVTRIESGFFGLLADRHDEGVEVRLLNPTERVRRMLWFRHYAERIGDETYRITGVRQEELDADGSGRAAWEADDDEDDET